MKGKKVSLFQRNSHTVSLRDMYEGIYFVIVSSNKILEAI